MIECILPGCNDPADHHNTEADYHKCWAHAYEEIMEEGNIDDWQGTGGITASEAIAKLRQKETV